MRPEVGSRRADQTTRGLRGERGLARHRGRRRGPLLGAARGGADAPVAPRWDGSHQEPRRAPERRRLASAASDAHLCLHRSTGGTDLRIPLPVNGWTSRRASARVDGTSSRRRARPARATRTSLTPAQASRSRRSPGIGLPRAGGRRRPRDVRRWDDRALAHPRAATGAAFQDHRGTRHDRRDAAPRCQQRWPVPGHGAPEADLGHGYQPGRAGRGPHDGRTGGRPALPGDHLRLQPHRTLLGAVGGEAPWLYRAVADGEP